MLVMNLVKEKNHSNGNDDPRFYLWNQFIDKLETQNIVKGRQLGVFPP